MPSFVDTRIASGVVVLIWAGAATALEWMGGLTPLTLALMGLIAAYVLATAKRIPIRRMPLRPARHVLILFVLPVVLSLLAVGSVALPGRPWRWAIIAATYIAAARLKDVIGSAPDDPFGA